MLDVLDVFNIDLIRAGIRLATPILLAALAGAICNRAGILNLALEGKMLMGAFLGIYITYKVGNTYLGIILALILGGLVGGIFALFYLKYEVNLILLALAFNLLALEVTVYFMRILFGNVGSWTDPSINRLPEINFLGSETNEGFLSIFNNHNLIVYISWALVVFVYIILFKTPLGRHVRSIGENQEAAETLGVNVARVQVVVLVVAGMLCALAGAFLSVGHMTMFTRNISNGRGWRGVAAAIFGFQHPVGVFFASLFFGTADALSLRIQSVSDYPPSLVKLIPQFSTIFALTIVGLRAKFLVNLARIKFRRNLDNKNK
jgi:simple sugar transport system permease protein